MFAAIMATLAFLAALAAAVIAWRKPSGGDTSALVSLEGRWSEEIGRLRASFESALRETTLALANSNTDASSKLQSSVAAQFQQFLQAQNSALAQFQQSETAALTTTRETMDARLDKMDATLRQILQDFRDALLRLQNSLAEGARMQAEQSNAATAQLGDTVAKRMDAVREALTSSLNQLQESVQKRLDLVRQDNEAKLEIIRATVDEKLHATLEARLGDSFKIVSERLELVHQGLGEMKMLAEGVGDLKRVLTNVRSRGTFGEVQLGALLEQILTPSQYDTNVATVPGSNERVEFAIKLPGRDIEGSIVYLPIDAKFPQESYERLVRAYEAGDAAAFEAARKELRVRLVAEANTICSKYVEPPHTTDFALLFVPTEGLYAEALRMDGLVEELQRKCHVILVGPTTLYAILNSLQMGFHTLAIEKRSSEVWRVLGAVKTEFLKFGDSLEAVGKKLSEASRKIEDSAKRSRVLERKLKNVEQLPEHEVAEILATEQPALAMAEEES